MNSGRIKKIVQMGSIRGNEWRNDGSVLVYYDDESRKPLEVPSSEGYKVYAEYARQNGLVGNLDEVVESMPEAVLQIVNRENQVEYETAMDEFYDAVDRAKTLQSEVHGQGPRHMREEDMEFAPEEDVKVNRHTGLKTLAAILAGTAIGSAGYALGSMMQKNMDADDEYGQNGDKDNDDEIQVVNGIDFDNATFDEIMSSMQDGDARKVVSEKAMNLVKTFHDMTHKDGNFRLEQDGQTYLDLSFEEALVLTTFANYDTAEELNDILGDYNITSVDAQNILESAREKMVTYYMNAIEPSGLAEIFNNEEDRAFFQGFESEVLNFNSQHNTVSSDAVIRDVYYKYIQDGATNYPNVSPMAKLLAFDTVYGGLNLVESASAEHTQFLEFHGLGEEEETKYYVENILKLDYNSLTQEQKDTYRRNIIESGTKLVDLLENGETMTEDNSTTEEMSATMSVTELVDKMGLCNDLNAEVQEKIQLLNIKSALKSNETSSGLTVLNLDISKALREAGHNALADRVDASINDVLSDDLLSEIREVSKDAHDAVENYEGKVSILNGTNRPTISQIINAANRYTSTLENYAGNEKDVATLINNRRHVPEQLTPDKDGYYGIGENGLPTYDPSVLDGKSDDDVDDFVKKHGEVIDEHTDENTEKVDEDDLTDKEKEEVEEQKRVIEAQIAVENASESAKRSANSYANSSSYKFSAGSVTNPLNGEVYNLNDMTFANGVAYAYAFAGQTVSTSDSQIQNACEVAAENYINSINADDRDAIARGMGTDWASAKAKIKESFKSGYISQMKSEIQTAISVGADMKKVNDKELAELKKLNEDKEKDDKSKEKVPEEEPNKETPEEKPKEETPDEKQEEDSTKKPDKPQEVDKGKEEVSPSQPEEVSPAPAPEEDDPNIGEQFGPGEQPYQPANSISEVPSKTEEVSPAPAPTEPPVVNNDTTVEQQNDQEAPAPSATPIAMPEETPVVSEETNTLSEPTVDVPQIVEEPTSVSESDSSIDVSDIDALAELLSGKIISEENDLGDAPKTR